MATASFRPPGGQFDALVVLGFGGPERPDELLPFLRRVIAGHNIPPSRLAEVGQHYAHFGGISPVNGQTRALSVALRSRLAAAGHELPVVVANRNSPPFVPDVLAELASNGHRNILVLATSAFASYSSCRQYREDLAAGAVSSQAVVKLPPFFELPGLEQAFATAVAAGLAGQNLATTRVLFSVHSLPVAMAAAAGPTGNVYVSQHRDLAARIMAAAAKLAGFDVEPTWEPGAGQASSHHPRQPQGGRRTIRDQATPGHVPGEPHPTLAWELVYQSRSGPPQVPWLEPDISDALVVMAGQGVQQVVVVPLGFLTDHMEVIWDLDTEAAATAATLGLGFHRVATPGDSPVFLDSLTKWVTQYLTHPTGPSQSGQTCFGDCCLVRSPGAAAVDTVQILG